ncbi:hypothetical protein [Methylophaga frappieri]|nr:hypothetical protein [Methylophaga frappieri]
MSNESVAIQLILKNHGYLSIFVVTFTLHDLIGMMTVGNGTGQKITRSIIRIISVPSVLIFIFQASQEPDLKSIIIFNIFIVFGLVGVSLSQVDHKYGVDPPYLDENSDEKTQTTMKIILGFIAIGVMTTMLCLKFSDTIYPKIPSYLGGPQQPRAEIHMEGKVIESEILLINSDWVVFVDAQSKKANKIRLGLIDKIIYK